MNKRFRGRSQHRGSKRFYPQRKRDADATSNQKNRNNFGNFARSEQNNTESLHRLKESDVGIAAYISEHEGINGVIKQRYSDFHVNEIDCDGNVVILSSIAPPKRKEKDEVAGEEQNNEENLKSIVSSEIFKKIKDLVNDSEVCDSSVEIDVTEMNKDDRRKLHYAIRSVTGGCFDSNTKEKEGRKFMIINKHNNKGRFNQRTEWPKEYGGDHVHFVLYKENMDTMETVNLLASRLRIKPNMINYAGTKDRRGITSQMMSVWRVEPGTLAQVNTDLHGIYLGNYSFKKKGLKLGDLQGNRFRIVLRNVNGNNEKIEKAVKSLSAKGFLNYYGLQRFGTSVAVPTHAIGKALLLGDWKLAVELILKPREGEQNHALAKARKIWWETRDAKKAVEELYNKEKLIEGRLLLGLSQCASNDYVNALEKIPRNTRLLYLHSYQSLVWNKLVSRRVRELGVKPIVGDLVLLKDTQAEIIEDSVLEDGGEKKPESVSVPIKKNAVKVITEEDLATVDIHDIVMPLPGHDVIYPENVMKDWYEDVLKLDGLSSANLKQSVRKYSVGGDYRKMVIRPDKLSWKTMCYSDPFKPLELSDLQKMKNEDPPMDEPNGIYKALVLSFHLPSSSYATMALREILKSDTSSQHQASLNDYHIKNNTLQSSEQSIENANEGSTSIETIQISVSEPNCMLSTSSQESKDNEANPEMKIDEPDGGGDKNEVDVVETHVVHELEEKDDTSVPNRDEKNDEKDGKKLMLKRGMSENESDVEEKRLKLI